MKKILGTVILMAILLGVPFSRLVDAAALSEEDAKTVSGMWTWMIQHIPEYGEYRDGRKYGFGYNADGIGEPIQAQNHIPMDTKLSQLAYICLQHGYVLLPQEGEANDYTISMQKPSKCFLSAEVKGANVYTYLHLNFALPKTDGGSRESLHGVVLLVQTKDREKAYPIFLPITPAKVEMRDVGEVRVKSYTTSFVSGDAMMAMSHLKDATAVRMLIFDHDSVFQNDLNQQEIKAFGFYHDLWRLLCS